MDRGCRIERFSRFSASGPGLRIACREEDHEIEDGDEPADDVLQCRRAAVSELRRLLRREIELGLARSTPSGPFTIGINGLVVSGSSSSGSSPG